MFCRPVDMTCTSLQTLRGCPPGCQRNKTVKKVHSVGQRILPQGAVVCSCISAPAWVLLKQHGYKPSRMCKRPSSFFSPRWLPTITLLPSWMGSYLPNWTLVHIHQRIGHTCTYNSTSYSPKKSSLTSLAKLHCTCMFG